MRIFNMENICIGIGILEHLSLLFGRVILSFSTEKSSCASKGKESKNIYQYDKK
jgi:hypothetical protein